MPSQASANDQKNQAVKPDQVVPGGYSGPDTPSLSATPSKVEIQGLQSVEDGRSEGISRKGLSAQVDGSIACFTVGRPPLYAGPNEDAQPEQEIETTRTGTARCAAGEKDNLPYQETTAIPFPKRCAVRTISGSVLRTRGSGNEQTSSKAIKASSTTPENVVDDFRSTSKLSTDRVCTSS